MGFQIPESKSLPSFALYPTSPFGTVGSLMRWRGCWAGLVVSRRKVHTQRGLTPAESQSQFPPIHPYCCCFMRAPWLGWRSFPLGGCKIIPQPSCGRHFPRHLAIHSYLNECWASENIPPSVKMKTFHIHSQVSAPFGAKLSRIFL